MTVQPKQPGQPVQVPEGVLGYLLYRAFNVLDSIFKGARTNWPNTLRAIMLAGAIGLVVAGPIVAIALLLSSRVAPLMAWAGSHAERGLQVGGWVAVYGGVAATAYAIQRRVRRRRATRRAKGVAIEASIVDTDRKATSPLMPASAYNVAPDQRDPADDPISKQTSDNTQAQRGQ